MRDARTLMIAVIASRDMPVRGGSTISVASDVGTGGRAEDGTPPDADAGRDAGGDAGARAGADDPARYCSTDVCSTCTRGAKACALIRRSCALEGSLSM